MTHPNEPTWEELKRIRKDLYAAESTDLNIKKIRAIETQIARRQKEVIAIAGRVTV